MLEMVGGTFFNSTAATYGNDKQTTNQYTNNKNAVSTMSLSSYFSKLKYGSCKNSKRASVYEEIANRYGVPPQHVFEIAHGKKLRTSVDSDIYSELVDKGIIIIHQVKI